ncbi:MAG: MBL fold metallo-hydrolase [Dehalococcoidia bacterium]
MQILQFVAEALGDASYLVIGRETAVAVDPQRDIRPLVRAANERRVTITHVFETHVHNDYVSGGRELAALGAEIAAPAESGLEFPFTAVGDGSVVSTGDVRLRALAAPGHTYEHTAYLALNGDNSVAGAFTGGAILMAAAGRTDLLGPEHTEELTRLQWESAHRIAAAIPASAEILPTHGAGSFCSSTAVCEERRAPLSVEQGRNVVLASPDFETFRALQLASPAPIPGYYRYMAPINRKGPKVYGEPPKPRALAPADIEALRDEGVHIVDVRRRQEFVAGHVPGSVVIEGDGTMLAYVGWLIPFNAPMALVTYDEAQAERATVDLFRIGYESVRGAMPFGAWERDGRPLARLTTVTAAEVAEAIREGGPAALDLRFANESSEQPVEGSQARPIELLPAWEPELDVPRAVLFCESGQRATMGASFLRRAGHDVAPLVEGGWREVQTALRR